MSLKEALFTMNSLFTFFNAVNWYLLTPLQPRLLLKILHKIAFPFFTLVTFHNSIVLLSQDNFYYIWLFKSTSEKKTSPSPHLDLLLRLPSESPIESLHRTFSYLLFTLLGKPSFKKKEILRKNSQNGDPPCLLFVKSLFRFVFAHF